jgi:hypothetical protein
MKDTTLFRGAVASFNITEQPGILQYHAAPWLPSTPRSSVASFNTTNIVASFYTTEQRGLIHHHGAAWHPSTPRSSVASFTTIQQRGFVMLKYVTLLRGVGGCHAAPWC